jgi:UDP-N-acetylglucosamine pyrophosphorylase
METKNAAGFESFDKRMREAGLSGAAIAAFRHNYDKLVAGHTGMIPETGIEPVRELPRLDSIRQSEPLNPALLSQTAIIKLNGGLGTSMGLEKAKSLLEIKNGLTFLDFIARQVLHLRKQHSIPLRFLLMNSFSTSADTRQFLVRYPELGAANDLELMQSQAPKVDARTFQPAVWAENPHLEWCPPGHGDIYPSLLGSGWLDRLLGEGVKYLFVSNSDNLGASLDLSLLSYFARTDAPFLMEVAERTVSDRKGGHLARRGSRLLLRESAQCPKEDEASFQDILRHRFFNTNNLWVRLDHLKQQLDQHGGFLPLPLIKNAKTLDPRRKDSPQVFQLETAMGAAIEIFDGAGAMVVPRSRFAPVKTTSDLLALRSDAYAVTSDWRVELANTKRAEPPAIDLDPAHYKLVDQLDSKLTGGVPSLKDCDTLSIQGPIQLSSANLFRGKVALKNPAPVAKPLPAGEYQDCTRELT